jgi:glycine/D-amino acid oxidase-like deaminating enzyme
MPGYGARYWAERTSGTRRRSYPKFKGQQTVDAVVIGGGITGCTAAYVFASAGLKTILLEADRVAEGSTASSLGMIVPEPDAMYREAEAILGRREGRLGWKAARKSAIDFAAALRKLSTKSDLSPASFVINAGRGDDAPALKKEQAARKEAGLDAPWLTAQAAAAEIGAESVGALRMRDAFTYDPVRAAFVLAGAAEAKGAMIFERSPVRRTVFTRKDADVVLADGKIRTRLIYVATGEPGSLFGQLRRHVRRREGYVVVTEPWSAAMKKEAGRRQSVVTEIGEAPHWWRWLSEDRALFAGCAAAPVAERLRDKIVIQRTGQLMYELSVRYPSISGLPAHWAWPVPVVSAPDGLPWIGTHRNYPFHFFALAMGWHGDGLAWFGAKAALRQAQDGLRQAQGTVRHAHGSPLPEDDAFGFNR